MNRHQFKCPELLTPSFLGVILAMVLLGLFFRFFRLDYKIYWHDETYTTMRAAGYTRDQIDQELFQNRVISAPSLQKFFQIKPGSTAADTIRSLATEDPQHPPLYFLLSRVWMQLFGSSYTATRSLSAVLSLLGLPLMYWLAMELFASPMAALLATALLALSPVNILFDQTARQYGLLTVAIIGSSWLLLRALRLARWRSWLWYAIATAVGLYTHPFFGLTLIGQGAYALLRIWMPAPDPFRRKRQVSTLKGFTGAIALALVLYAPWLWVLVSNMGRALATTDWSRVSPGLPYLVKLWTLSFTSVFFDLDFGFDNPWTFVVRGVFMVMIGWALYTVCRRTPPITWLFILTSVLIPFLLLALPDVIQGGKRSAVTRYLISCFPGIQLAVGYWLMVGLRSGQRIWQGILALVLAGSIASCTVSAAADTWWSKDLSYSNGKIARYINSLPAPVVISNLGDDYTNTGDLLAMSDRLEPKVKLLLLHPKTPDLTLVETEHDKGSNLLIFRASDQLRNQLAQQQWQLIQVMSGERLTQPTQRDAEYIWRLKKFSGV